MALTHQGDRVIELLARDSPLGLAGRVDELVGQAGDALREHPLATADIDRWGSLGLFFEKPAQVEVADSRNCGQRSETERESKIRAPEIDVLFWRPG